MIKESFSNKKPGSKCKNDSDCISNGKSLCLGGYCCHSNVYWNQTNCDSCSTSGWCNGCKKPFSYYKKNGSWDCYLKEDGGSCKTNENCNSNLCLNGNCCKNYIKAQQKRCGSCSSSGWCNGCKSKNFEYVKKNGNYNCFPKENTCESKCASGTCLGGKCCSDWIVKYDKGCGKCNSQGYCDSCKDNYMKTNKVHGSYKSYKKKYINELGTMTKKE